MSATGVVLHRAGTERVKLTIDGKVLPRQIGEMANHLQFRDFRQTNFAFAKVFDRQAGRGFQRFGELRPGTAARARVIINQHD